MDTRRVALCFLLLLVILNASVEGHAEVCKYRVPTVPFCKEWSCKAECWMEAKLIPARVQEHRCIKDGIMGQCRCVFCGKDLTSD